MAHVEAGGHPLKALLLSTYELGRQPFGLASPAAWLRRAGWEVECVDLARDRLRREAAAAAALVGIHLPMHTATRLAGPVIEAVRRLNPSARVCAYGLYAPLNADWLRALGVDDILGGEFEDELSRIAERVREAAGSGEAASSGEGSLGAPSVRDAAPGPKAARARGTTRVPRIRFLVPDRRGLPPLARYAALQMPDGSRRVVGSTEASRGCKHFCRHCPVVPVYEGQFRIIPPAIVLADIEAQIAAGARHITFGDPDFLNGPTHALRVVEALHAAHPDVTYDVTIKIEHLLEHRAVLPHLRDTGCLFVTSAVESLDDAVLERLAKGHTRADFVEAVALCRSVGLALAPTFVAFHPWITLAGYCDLLDTIEALDLVDHVAPIQLAIRLLLPKGSRMMALDEVRAVVQGFDPVTLTYRWVHPDPRVDQLQRDVASLVGVRAASDRRAIFDEISALAHERAGLARPPAPSRAPRAGVPFLSEPWYCCAEPNPDEVLLV